MDAAAARTELLRRLEALRVDAARAPAATLARDLDQFRALAAAHGLRSAATVAQVLAASLATVEHRAMLGGWLPLLNDAVKSHRHDNPACQAFAAACRVRLAH